MSTKHVWESVDIKKSRYQNWIFCTSTAATAAATDIILCTAKPFIYQPYWNVTIT